MANRVTGYLKNIRAQEKERKIDSYWIDDLIISISTNDGDASSVSIEDVETHMQSLSPNIDQYAKYQDANDLILDIGCYLTARYMNYATKNPYSLTFALDETTPWVKSYYDNTCTPSNLGRLFGYSYESAPELETKNIFPRKIITARKEKIRNWMRLGWRWRTQISTEDSKAKPTGPKTDKVAKKTKTQWIPATSREELFLLLEEYPNYPKELRHEIALKTLDAMEEMARDDERLGRMPGIGQLVNIIVGEEKRAGYTEYANDISEIYKDQLDVKKVFKNLGKKEVDIDNRFLKFFRLHPTTFMGKVINFWGRIGYIEPGESKILMKVIGYLRRGDGLGHLKKVFAINNSFDASSKCVAIKALGNMAYIDSEEKKDVADYLKSFINNEISKTDWYKSENLRPVFEAIVSLGKLGITRLNNKSIIAFVSKFFYSPLHKKADQNLGWINLAGLRALTHLYDYASENEKKLIYQTVLSDGLSHPVDHCRIYSYAFLLKIRRQAHSQNLLK